MKSSKEIIDYLSQFASDNRVNLFHEKVIHRTNYISIALENIYQPHNASAVVRTCDCLGIQNIHVIQNQHAFKPSKDVVLGSANWINIEHYTSSSNCVEKLKNDGYRIIATSLNENSLSLPDFDLNKGKSLIVFGTEKSGLSQEILSQADEHLIIPMYGFTESYNISVSAAIILYTLVQKLKESNILWQLSENEKNEILIEWLRKSIKSSELILNQFLNK